MYLTVKLQGSLRTYIASRERLITMSLPAGRQVEDVLAQFTIPIEAVGFMLLKGAVCQSDAELRDGDCLELFPLVGGGLNWPTDTVDRLPASI